MVGAETDAINSIHIHADKWTARASIGGSSVGLRPVGVGVSSWARVARALGVWSRHGAGSVARWLLRSWRVGEAGWCGSVVHGRGALGVGRLRGSAVGALGALRRHGRVERSWQLRSWERERLGREKHREGGGAVVQEEPGAMGACVPSSTNWKRKTN
jgi:hypothetical protein